MKYKLLGFGYPVGLLILTTGIVLISLKGVIVKHFINQNIRLVPGTFLYDSWVNTTVDLYSEFYLFNLVNGKELEATGAKPEFQEIGPFVYKEVRFKEDLVNNSNGTLTFKERRRFFFVPEKSAYPEDFNITTINMAAMVVLDFTRYWTKLELKAVELALKIVGETLLITQPAGKLLFGYEDPFLKILFSLDKDILPTDRIGLYFNKNDTVDGEYTIFDGVKDSHQIGQIDRFNGMKDVSVWSDSYANQINGTDGSLNFPFMNKSSNIQIFQSDACRTINMVYNETVQTFHDINLDGFIMNEYMFANVSVNPSNAGFCTPAGNCLVSGVFNLSNCVQIGPLNIPAYLSMPHFLFGDQSLVDDVKGLKPNFTKHRTIVYYQPLTGLPMIANKRIQLNTKLIRNANINLTKNLPQVYFPLFWIDENFAIDEKSALLFHWHVGVPLEIYDFLKIFILVIGLMSFTFCIAVTTWIMFSGSNSQGSSLTSSPEIVSSSPGESDERTPLIIN